MLRIDREKVLWATGLASLVNVGLGGWQHSLALLGAGAAGLCFVGYRAARRPPALPACSAPPPWNAAAAARPAARTEPSDVGELVQQMLAEHRYALLLRPKIAANLSAAQRAAARDALEVDMALVPEGIVQLGSEEADAGGDEPLAPVSVRIEALYLDRFQVTNAKYQQFVTAGGYEQMSLWEPAIWPAVLDFTDSTGHPGPRFWRQGQYPAGADRMPVVGVSWYEAAAYARWAGKRLVTTTEWLKASSWPVPLSPTTVVSRRFPWGDGMDRQRCNIWGSGPNQPVAVDEFAGGVSVGGIYQMVGNVWEWSADDFGPPGALGRDLLLTTPMKTLQGGAYDTYFDNQATNQFQSGDLPLARKPNVGFRCAIGLCDLMLSDTPPDNDDDLAAASMAGTAETSVGDLP